VSSLGARGAALGAPGRTARAALQTAMAVGTGGAGAVVSALAAARGTAYGSLALMGNAATTVLGRDAGRGLVTGAGLVASVPASGNDPRPAASACSHLMT